MSAPPDRPRLWKLTRSVFARAFLYILGKAGIKFSRALIYVVPLTVSEQNTRLYVTTLSIKVCTKDDLRKMSDRRVKRFETNMINGHFLLGAFWGDRLVAHLWLSIADVYVSEFERKIAFDGAYIWDLYTDRSFRRMGVAKELISRALDVAKRKFKTERVYAIVKTDNVPSRIVFERIGFKPLTLVTFSKFLGRIRYKEEDLSTY